MCETVHVHLHSEIQQFQHADSLFSSTWWHHGACRKGRGCPGFVLQREIVGVLKSPKKEITGANMMNIWDLTLSHSNPLLIWSNFTNSCWINKKTNRFCDTSFTQYKSADHAPQRPILSQDKPCCHISESVVFPQETILQHLIYPSMSTGPC